MSCVSCKELTCPGFVPDPQMKAHTRIHQLASDAANLSLPSLVLPSRDLRKDPSQRRRASSSEPGGHCQTEYNNIIKGRIQSKQTNKRKRGVSLQLSSSSRQAVRQRGASSYSPGSGKAGHGVTATKSRRAIEFR